jgi:hypothetical protein
MNQKEPHKFSEPLPEWAKALIGIAVIGALVKWTPILELMTGFIYFCLIPLIALASVSVTARSVFHMILGSWKGAVEQMNRAVEEKLKNAA